MLINPTDAQANFYFDTFVPGELGPRLVTVLLRSPAGPDTWYARALSDGRIITVRTDALHHINTAAE